MFKAQFALLILLALAACDSASRRQAAEADKADLTLPPMLRLKEKDREKYLAIGESDRMTLKFVKRQ